MLLKIDGYTNGIEQVALGPCRPQIPDLSHYGHVATESQTERSQLANSKSYDHLQISTCLHGA